jgi:hypothetical protein
MKKLTLALLAFLAVGAAAQNRHYEGANGVIHVHPNDQIYRTQIIEVVPVRQVTPVERVIVVPDGTVHHTIWIDDDTADVPLIYPNVRLEPTTELEIYRRVEIRELD